MCLTGWLLDRLAALRYRNGEPMTRIYGPASTATAGAPSHSTCSIPTGAAGRCAHRWAWPVAAVWTLIRKPEGSPAALLP